MQYISRILCLILSFWAINLHAESTQVTQTVNPTINKTINTWMKKNNVPGVAVQVYQKDAIQPYYLGVENKQTKSPVTEKTIFEVGSWTKLFTCLLTAEEVNAGEMKLGDSVQEYVPYLGKGFHSVTILNLATHTGGLPFTVPDNIKTPEALFTYYKNWQSVAPVGTHWAYSNMSIGLLGNATQAMGRSKMNSLYIKNILAPLGMQSIGFRVPKELEGYYAQGYDAKGNPVLRTQQGLYPSAYALRMSANDSGLFLKAALDIPGTPEDIAQAMKTSQTPYFHVEDHDQGLGWVIYPMTYPITKKEKDALLNVPIDMNRGPLTSTMISQEQRKFDGNMLIDKTGGTDGFRSYIVFIPNKKIGVTVLVNQMVSNREIVRLGREILLQLV